MIIDLSSVLNYEGSTMEIDLLMKIDKIEYMGETYILSEPVKILGTISNVGDALEFNAKVSGMLKIHCYRCLKETEYKFSFKMNEILINQSFSNTDNEEVIHFQGNRINIRDIVINNTLVNLPMKHLCSQDCKGLCPSCGADLNIDSCNCKKDNIDPRFEVLKELFKQE